MKRETFLPFSLPSIGQEEIDEVSDTLRSGWLSTGPKVNRFEGEFADYVGAKHAIAVNSCTAGLKIALVALGISSGDEVVLPTFTFCSAANVVVHLGAKPILVDVGKDFNLNVELLAELVETRLRSGNRIKAIIPVDHSGQPCDLQGVADIARRHGLEVVEDAAHAVGAEFSGQKIGSFSRVTAFSFYAIKNMTTGEGGMITTADDELAARMRLLSMHGMSKDAWKRYEDTGSWYYEIEAAGFKQNMTDIQASLGIHQLRKLDGFIQKRTKFAQIYSEVFAEVPELEVPSLHADRKHAWHLYVMRLRTERLRINRAQFIEELSARNIGTSVHFIPVHLHPFYKREFAYRKGDFPVAEHLFERIISLPLYPRMTEQDVMYVADSVLDVVRRYRK